MLKTLVKWMIPSSEKLAKMAAEAARDCINSLPADHATRVARSAKIAEQASQVVSKLTSWLADGKMDEAETEELARALLPLVDKVKAHI